MCVKKGCNSYTQTCHCCLQCSCNYSCYSCKIARKYYETPCTQLCSQSNIDVRKKYVCFPCKRIWKSPFSKYIVDKIDNHKDDWESHLPHMKHFKNNEPIATMPKLGDRLPVSDDFVSKCLEANKNNPYDKSDKYTIRFVDANNYKSGYHGYLITNDKGYVGDVGSNCAKCSGPGTLVGRNFRHCINNKSWKEMEEKYKDNPEGLYKDFVDYPRENEPEPIRHNKKKIIGVAVEEARKNGHTIRIITNNGGPVPLDKKVKSYYESDDDDTLNKRYDPKRRNVNVVNNIIVSELKRG